MKNILSRKHIKNFAFIDRQNLHLGTREENWSIDFRRFRVYLKDKYKVEEAYYFIGYMEGGLCNQSMYNNIQRAGFILVFKNHASEMVTHKKGNVDSDIIFQVTKDLVDRKEEFDKVILVSGDGDYNKLVDYLITKNKFEKNNFPK